MSFISTQSKKTFGQNIRDSFPWDWQPIMDISIPGRYFGTAREKDKPFSFVFSISWLYSLESICPKYTIYWHPRIWLFLMEGLCIIHFQKYSCIWGNLSLIRLFLHSALRSKQCMYQYSQKRLVLPFKSDVTLVKHPRIWDVSSSDHALLFYFALWP